MKNISDSEFISLLQTNSSEGMSLFMDAYMGLLWSACELYLDNPEDIKDCIQDIVLDFYEHLDRYEVQKGSIKAYLYTIAKRKAGKMVLKQRIFTEELKEEHGLQNEDWTDEIVDKNMLEQAISELHPQDSDVIRMRYYHGMTYTEIARAMDLPYETIKKRHQRSMKKLRLILIAMAIFAVLTACAVVAVYRYRFSENTGIQDNKNEIWYEMTDAPMIFETKKGIVTIHNVLWKEEMVIIDLEYENHALSDDEVKVKLYRTSSAGEESLSVSNRSSTVKGANGTIVPIKRKEEFHYIEAKDEYVFLILGEKCTVKMQPIKQFETLSDIGNAQTHNGRTIVLQQDLTDEKQNIKAYVHSEDVWKIAALDGWSDYTWDRYELTDGYAFKYIDKDNINPDEIHIRQLSLVSNGETPIVEFDVPETSAKVEIPFSIGEDQYMIKEIMLSRGTYQHDVDPKMQESVRENGGELIIKIEPVVIEKGTTIYGIQVILGEWKEQKYTNLENQNSFQMIESNIFASYCLDDNLEPTDSVIRLQFMDLNDLPDHVVLKIEHIYKFWEQEYRFDLN